MKKKLLSEAQVRRFMGLAGIKPVNEMAYKHDDEEMEEGLRGSMAKRDDMEEGRRGPAMKKDDDTMEEAMHDDKDMEEGLRGSAMKKDDDLLEQDDMDKDMEGGDADVEMDEEDLADVKAALDTLQDKLAPLLDQAEEGGMEADEDPMKDEEPAMDEEPPMPDMDKEDDMDKDLQEVELELTEEEEKEKMEEIVNEVARRVAKRIVEAKRAHKKMNEALGRKK